MSLAEAMENARPPEPTGSAEVTSNEVKFSGIKSTEVLSDWSGVFRSFNLDPEAFYIVDDSVRMKMYQQSKRTEDGDRDVINLYSYDATFRRKAGHVDENTLESLRERIDGVKMGRRRVGHDTPAIANLSDWQLGKTNGEGIGTAQTVDRINRGREGFVEYIDQRRALGYTINSAGLFNMGDPNENVQGSYDSQAYTVDLNLRDQITLAIDLSLAWIRDVAPLVPELTYAGVLCNHGQLSRGSGKTNVTNDSDNAAGLIGDTLERVCRTIPGLSNVRFVVPRDQMITRVNMGGVNMSLAHGHKITGSEANWLASQTNALNHDGWRTDLWVTAHRHSLKVEDFGPYCRVQCTTVDPGSKHFTDATGKYSTPGTTVFLVDEEHPQKFRELAVL